MNRRRQAFTLIELLVVVTIITILAAVVAVNLFQEPGKAKRAAAKAQIVAFRTALKIYSMDNNGLPTQEQGLRALVEKATTPPVPTTFPPEGYIESRQVPPDPWGNEYVYRVPGSRGESMEIVSYGKDGKPGGEGEAADISSSDL